MNCQEGLATYTAHSNSSATIDSILLHYVFATSIEIIWATSFINNTF